MAPTACSTRADDEYDGDEVATSGAHRDVDRRTCFGRAAELFRRPPRPSMRPRSTRRAGTVGQLDPDVLAVQEFGDPDAQRDLDDRRPGAWRAEVVDPDGLRIRAGVVSKAVSLRNGAGAGVPGQARTGTGR
jgi:hypothetical protein